MSGKPQQNQGEAQDDILEQIIAQELKKNDTPAQEEPPTEETAAEASPTPEREAENKTPPPEKKNKRSSVYIYLLILFGAAFMMLLLAYFVQQRNSETAYNDLRDSMNLSREELMEEIKTLEQEKEMLTDSLAASEKALQAEQEKRGDVQQEAEDNSQAALRYYWEKDLSDTLGWLERFCAEGDWLMAAVVETEDLRFNENNRDHGQALPGLEPSPLQVSRYLELREQVYDYSGVMIVETVTPEGQDSTERPYINPTTSRYEEETIAAAKALWEIFHQYSRQDVLTAQQIEKLDSDTLERLNGRAFRDSTRAAFRQIVDDLIENGALTENEDGTFASRIVTSKIGDETVSVWSSPIPSAKP